MISLVGVVVLVWCVVILLMVSGVLLSLLLMWKCSVVVELVRCMFWCMVWLVNCMGVLGVLFFWLGVGEVVYVGI